MMKRLSEFFAPYIQKQVISITQVTSAIPKLKFSYTSPIIIGDYNENNVNMIQLFSRYFPELDKFTCFSCFSLRQVTSGCEKCNIFFTEKVAVDPALMTIPKMLPIQFF